MQVHFMHQNVQDTMVIFEEVNLPHPRCPQFYMMVPWIALNGSHLATVQCTREAEQKIRQLVEEELWESSERVF